ncbi:Aste57867_15220 [Aphanomyces stellatus]|uniref:Aste57867_15220 protein n=1 Tax=Aphanomyces stellatus TaxID=120398 RepID=A0A485L381_9STRA|nr:hypothetical protein As57867_015164 [Aphanomyces stellatus]VFT92029.1 Aste57867_15220 [Aphanomyces stellatus]
MALASSDSIAAISKRLDSLPTTGGCGGLSRYFLKLLHSTGVGWAMDSMDTFLFVYCIGFIEEDLKANYGRVISGHEMGILGSAVFAGSLVGSFLFGHLADMYGRKPMFMWTMVVFLFGNVMCAVSDSYGMLLTFRFIAGIGLGGELPVATTLVQELSPKAIRGRMIVILDGFWPIGCIIAILLAKELTKVMSWRYVFLLASVPVVYALVARMFIPESPKWLASVGRKKEAQDVLLLIENAHDIYHRPSKIALDQEHMAADVFSYRHLTNCERLRLLFQGVYLRRTLVLWFVWTGISFAYYAIYIWLPVIIASTRKGAFDINQSTWSLVLVVAFQLPGYITAAFAVERIGRRFTLVLFLMGSFASALAFGYVQPTAFNLLTAGCSLSFFMLGAWGALYAYTPENYPTNIRAIGAAYPAGVSRVGAIAGTYVIPVLYSAGWSPEAIMWLNGAILMVCSVVILVYGYETRGKDIDNVVLTTLIRSEQFLTSPNESDILSPDLLEERV